MSLSWDSVLYVNIYVKEHHVLADVIHGMLIEVFNNLTSASVLNNVHNCCGSNLS